MIMIMKQFKVIFILILGQYSSNIFIVLLINAQLLNLYMNSHFNIELLFYIFYNNSN